MKRQNEVKLNSFSGSSNVAITGRYGFSQDTDTDITRSYDIEVLRFVDDEKEDFYRNADPRLPSYIDWAPLPCFERDLMVESAYPPQRKILM